MRFIIFALFLYSQIAAAAINQEGLPSCRAELNDENNMLIQKIEWREKLFMGSIEGATRPVLITTSLGDHQIMSLWVREKTNTEPYGLFSFVDLSSGREQYLRFYMSNRFSVGVTFVWGQ
jgi:hypothetical protein